MVKIYLNEKPTSFFSTRMCHDIFNLVTDVENNIGKPNKRALNTKII